MQSFDCNFRRTRYRCGGGQGQTWGHKEVLAFRVVQVGGAGRGSGFLCSLP